MFDSAEEKEAKRRARLAEEAARQAAADEQRKAREHAAWAASPVGRATLAKQAGQRFLELQLQVGSHRGDAMFGSTTSTRTESSSEAVLADIEELGWQLEHAGYFFMTTGQSSTGKVFLSGEETSVSGVTVGVYLFRNPEPVVGGAAPSE